MYCGAGSGGQEVLINIDDLDEVSAIDEILMHVLNDDSLIQLVLSRFTQPYQGHISRALRIGATRMMGAIWDADPVLAGQIQDALLSRARASRGGPS